MIELNSWAKKGSESKTVKDYHLRVRGWAGKLCLGLRSTSKKGCQIRDTWVSNPDNSLSQLWQQMSRVTSVLPADKKVPLSYASLLPATLIAVAITLLTSTSSSHAPITSWLLSSFSPAKGGGLGPSFVPPIQQTADLSNVAGELSFSAFAFFATTWVHQCPGCWHRRNLPPLSLAGQCVHGEPTHSDLKVGKAGTRMSYYLSGDTLIAIHHLPLRRLAMVGCCILC